MSRLSIRRPHALKHSEARTRVTRVADRLGERFGAACQWEGDVLRIEHPQVNGTIRVTRDEIIIDARLGFALALFRDRAEREIAQFLDREFAG